MVKATGPQERATRRRTKRLRPSKMTVEQRTELFRRWQSADPEPKSDLEYVNVYTLLVAVVLSAQATDEGVNRATRDLFKRAKTPREMLALGEDAVREQIKTIGLYRNKAKNVIALSEILERDHGGSVPADRDTLESLPGVGRKTANVVMNVAFGARTIAVDTHIFRVANRMGLAPGEDVVEVERNLERLVPDEFLLHSHHWLILHGRYVCKARKPACEVCRVHDLCMFKEKRPKPDA